MSGWISGFMELPPGAIKDAEGVGDACQVFVVSSCQNGTLDFGLADPNDEAWNEKTAQRVLLNTGDFFYVPPENIYRFISFSLFVKKLISIVMFDRLENHSKTTTCLIYWTIIRPIKNQEEQEEGYSLFIYSFIIFSI